MQASTRNKPIALASVFIIDDGSAPPGIATTIEEVLDKIGFSNRIFTVPREELTYVAVQQFITFSDRKRKKKLYIILVSQDEEASQELQLLAQDLLREHLDYIKFVHINPIEIMENQEDIRKVLMSKLVRSAQEIQDTEEGMPFIRFVDEWGIAPGTGMYTRTKRELVCLCNFTARIVREIHILHPEDEEEETVLLEVELNRKDEKTTVKVPSQRLHNANNWLPPNFYLNDVPKASDRFIGCLKATSYLLGKVEKQKLYSTTGWVYQEEEGHIFITPRSPLFHATGSELPYDVLPQEEILLLDRKALRDALMALLECHTKQATLGLLAASAVAPLLPHLRQATPVDFGIALLAPTGTGKTTLAKLVISLYGKELAFAPMLSWEGTTNALESALTLYSGLPVLIDDLRPPTSSWEQKAINEKVQLVTRLYTHRSGKPRATASGGLRKSRPINSFLLLTGEQELVNVPSVRNRFVTLKLKSDDACWKTIGKLQDNPLLLNALGSIYIHALKKRLDASKDNFIATLKTLWEKGFHASPPVEQRLKSAYATLSLALSLFISSLQDEGVLDESTAEEILLEGHKAIYRAVIEHQKTVSEANQLNRFVEALKKLISVGEIVYARDDISFNEMRYRKLIWNMRRGKTYIAIPTGIISFVQMHLTRIGEPPLNEKQLREELAKLLGGEAPVIRCRPPWNSSQRIYAYRLPARLLEEEDA